MITSHVKSLKPEVLEILEWREVKQNHDEQHLSQRKLARPIALSVTWDQFVAFPFLKGFLRNHRDNKTVQC